MSAPRDAGNGQLPASNVPLTLPGAAERRRATATRRSSTAVIAVFFVHGLLFASWTAHIPDVKRDLHLSVGLLGVALLAAPLGSLAAMVLCGFLLPRLGSRRVVRIALVGYCVSGPVIGLTGSLIAFFLVFMVWGGFQGALDVSMNSQAVVVERDSGKPRMPGFHGAWSLGSLAGALLGAMGAGVGLSLSVQLLVIATPAVALVGWLTTRLVPDRAPPAPAPAPADGSTASLVQWLRSVPVLRPAVAVLGLLAVADMLCEGAAADWASVYFRDSLHTTAFVAGLAYTTYLLAMTAVRLSGNRLMTQLTKGRLVPSVAAIGAAGFSAGIAIDRPWAMLVGFGCLGAGLALVVPTVFTAAGRIAGLHPSSGVAAVAACGWVGFVAGPPLIGLLASASSLRMALVAVPVLLSTVAVGTALLPLPAPPTHPENARSL